MNITLIGMPGSGKSYVGKQLAKALDLTFIDPDKVLEKDHSRSLPEIVEILGREDFLRTEADLSVTAVAKDNVVLSTGGSIIYSSEAMEVLKQRSTIVYLKVDLETLGRRIGDTPRGIIGLGDKTFAQIYEDRAPLYLKWATLTIDGSQSPREIIDDVKKGLGL